MDHRLRLRLRTITAIAVVVGLLPQFTTMVSATEIGSVAAANERIDGTPPGASTRVLELGNKVFADELIVSSEIGSGQFVFLDQTTLTVSPGSEIVLDRYVFDPASGSGEIALTLTKGVLRFIGGKVTKTGEAVITTPHATIGIRGGIAAITAGLEGTNAVFLAGVNMCVTGKLRRVCVTRPGGMVAVKASSPEGGTSQGSQDDSESGETTESSEEAETSSEEAEGTSTESSDSAESSTASDTTTEAGAGTDSSAESGTTTETAGSTSTSSTSTSGTSASATGTSSTSTSTTSATTTSPADSIIATTTSSTTVTDEPVYVGSASSEQIFEIYQSTNTGGGGGTTEPIEPVTVATYSSTSGLTSVGAEAPGATTEPTVTTEGEEAQPEQSSDESETSTDPRSEPETTVASEPPELIVDNFMGGIKSDVSTLGTSGDAIFTGPATATITEVGGGGTTIVPDSGSFQMIYNFGSRSGAATISGIAGTTFSSSVSEAMAPAAEHFGGALLDTSNALANVGSVAGSFFTNGADTSAATAGDFDFSRPIGGGVVQSGTGSFTGDKLSP